jgi:hypothetical protein
LGSAVKRAGAEGRHLASAPHVGALRKVIAQPIACDLIGFSVPNGAIA